MSANQLSFEKERGVTDIFAQQGVAQLLIDFGNVRAHPDAMLRVLDALRREEVSIDLLKLADNGMSFVVEEALVETVERVVSSLEYHVKVNRDRAIVCLIAANMREMVGVMATIAEALREAGATIEQAGDSHDRVMALMDGAKLPAALQTLRAAFGLESVA